MTATRHAVIRGRNIFRDEIRRARRLDFTVQISDEDGEVWAMLVPDTDKARAICKANGATAVRAHQAYDDPAAKLDAARLAIESVLQLVESA